MNCQRFRRAIASYCVLWTIAAAVLCALQPFLAVHFRQDGWEDEPGMRVRLDGETAQFTPDGRPTHSDRQETTLFVPTADDVDMPDLLQQAIPGMSLLFCAVWLLFAVYFRQLFTQNRRLAAERVSPAGGAPPLSSGAHWHPPKTAPPQVA